MSIKQFRNIPREKLELSRPLRKYSIIGDVLSYLLCPRQYGYFKVRNIVPSAQGQLFFGEVIHNVLDRVHLHYRKANENQSNSLPTENEIDQYFDIVSKALKSQGIRPLSKSLEQRARKLIKQFVFTFGHSLFPRVKDTEHKLQIQASLDNGLDYILHGVVDVLFYNYEDGNISNEKVEIWDYKGGRIPDEQYLKNYEFQMLVYSFLFKQKNGFYPEENVLFFIGEMDRESNLGLSAEELLDRCIVKVKIDEQKIKYAMKKFEEIVEKIEDEYNRPFDKQWLAPKVKPPETMCATCDIRWSCENPNGKFELSGL